MNTIKKMPRTKYDYELDMLQAFKHGMTIGYGVDHENIHESENEAILEFAEHCGFKTCAIDKCLFD